MFDILTFIYKHPLNSKQKIASLFKFFKWQLIARLWNGSFIYNWIAESRLIISKGMAGATGNIYVGLMEYEDMSFLLHYLQQDDLFFDIGSNVGVYTVLASKVKNAKTIAIEPIPSTYEYLMDNLQINRLENVISKNIGIGNKVAKLAFTSDKDTMNSVATPGDINTFEIDVDTLDNLVQVYGAPKIIKIDVEGYEYNVIAGGMNLLQDNKLEAIIIELNSNGMKYGFDDNEIHTILQTAGFNAYTYDPFQRNLLVLEKHKPSHNTIYIRSSAIDKVVQQLKASEKISINGMNI
jgi:FkbM family methyltransferase